MTDAPDGRDRRLHERIDAATIRKISVQVQEGMAFHPFNSRLLDFSVKGMRFLEVVEPEIVSGRTVVVEIWTGDPPEPRFIDGTITWTHNYGGELEFGVEFFEELAEPPIPD
jgi:hypothetical protein